ncbi:TNT domain-containing protein [Kitasatospora sp. CB01950]|uniref:TNT domain-containing protein n=1 Tax=Kitasatospora sp. CB01950 TaxID=1703930 RepID=UPI00093A3D57|nr:TNT domain-containing protein [Kitasatospora sp. CB01950]
MRLRSLFTVSLACALPLTGLAGVGTAAARPGDVRSVLPDDCPVRTVPPVEHPELYYCKDPRLGPAVLPNTEPVATLLRGYQRFGGLSATNFVKLYAKADTGDWEYPADRGFQRLDGKVDQTRWTVPVGTKLDRFGELKGGYISDPGTPLTQRSMTPDTLNPDSNGKVYHCLNTLKPFDVQRGHIAAFAAMPGGGIQEWLDRTLKPAELGDKDYKIDVLIAEKYLEEVSADHCVVTPTGA